jgi:hypothetical protein
MDMLNWDLSVLSKAVAYSNLSGASAHVGLSQPQLSRIIAKLEDQFGVQLLDRDAKRKSSWTSAAFRLAEIYGKTLRQFEGDVHLLIEGNQVRQLRIGTLEGLVELASKTVNQLMVKSAIRLLELHVFDLSELEEKFFKGELDFIFTSREPGRKKYTYSKVLGYQTLDQISGAAKGKVEYRVYSPYQFTPHQHETDERGSQVRTVVSNSLFIRQQWVKQFGGTATVPSIVSKKKSGSKNEESVLLLGQEHFTKSFWENISE